MLIEDGAQMLAGLRAAPTSFGRAALGRAIVALAAQADLPIDRIEDAGLVTDEVLAGLERTGAPLAVAVDARRGRLGVLVGPFADGAGRATLGAGAAPGIGPILERIADGVVERTGDHGEIVEITFGANMNDGAGSPSLATLLVDLRARPAVAGFVAFLPAVAASAAVIRQAIGGIGEDLGLAADAVDDIKLAVSEACANVVVHAYPDRSGSLEVDFRPGDRTLVVGIHDDGIGLSPHRPGEVAEPASSGLGLGLELMATLTREMSIGARPSGGTSIRLEFELHPDAEGA